MNPTGELKTLFREYADFVKELPRESTLQKLLMTGPHSGEHPGHMAFYDAVGKWAAQLKEAAPSQEQLLQALEVLLFEANCYLNTEAHWFMVAAQRHALELIPLLEDANKSSLAERFAKNYPARMRMPMQQDILRMLEGKRKKKGFFSFLK